MKKLILTLIILLLAANAFATDGTVTQSLDVVSNGIARVTFVCTGGSSGTIPNTVMSASTYNYLTKSNNPWWLYEVTAYPTSGGTAPDAASVFVLETGTGLYLLGSEDGGTTAYNGLNLIHATLSRSCFPNMYIPRAGIHKDYFAPIKNNITLIVADQATASANWTVVFTFVQ